MGKRRPRWTKNHEKIKQVLVKQKDGLRKGAISRETGISRRIVDEHLKVFGPKVIYEDKLLFWKTNYEETWHLKKDRKNLFPRIMDLLNPILAQMPQEISKIRASMFENYSKQITHTVKLAIEKALEYIPEGKENEYLRDIERIFKNNRSNYEAEDHGDTLVLRHRKTGMIHPGVVIHKEK